MEVGFTFVLPPVAPMEPAAPPPPTPPTRAWPVFWVTLVLGWVCVIAKMTHVTVPAEWTPQNREVYLRNIVVISASDALYATALGLVAWPLLHMARRRRRLQAILWACFVAIAFASVVFAIVSVKVFHYLRMPLSYPLLYLANDTKNMRSSVMHYATPGAVVALLAVPLAFAALAWAAVRWNVRPPGGRRWGWVWPAALLVLVVNWVVYAQVHIHGRWANRDDIRVVDNPHYELAKSFVVEWIGAGSVKFDEPYPESHLADFRTVAERGGDAAKPTPGIPRGPKNVIVVIMESVGTQHLSLYGSPFRTTPRLEREAQHALVFDGYYSHITNTANSLVSLLLSVYTEPLDYREVTVENPRIPGHTAASVLKQRGYRTAFISAGDNEYSNQHAFLKDRGFDDVWDYRQSGFPLRDAFTWGVHDAAMVDMVLKWLDANPGKPFCIYSWTQGTHHNYEPYPGQEEIDFKVDEKKWKGMSWDLGRYLNSLHEADRQIGRLLDGLRSRGLADDTIVIITGDHGEAFGWPHASYGHSGKVHEPDVNVPMIIWSPGLFRNEPRRRTVGAHVDLSPTVLDLLNVDLPPTWQGRSLLSPDHPNRAYLYGAMDDKILGVREGPYKYILNVNRGRDALHDLAADPLEQTNLAQEKPEVARQLRTRLAAWVAYMRK